MLIVRNVTGLEKKLFILVVKIRVFLNFIPELLKGRLTVRQFIVFLQRLLLFLSKMQHNKFVKIDNKTRIDLYVPGFPSSAFYTACRKFMVFGEKLPCTTVLVSVTSACRMRCKHCYQMLDIGKDVDIDLLAGVVKKLQDMGIAFFNIEGGEPFLVYDRLKKICEVIDERSEIWINSAGDGITLDRLIELKKKNVTAIMFSLHSPDADSFNSFMGNDNAWNSMVKAIELCHKAGVAVAINSCLLREDFYNGKFENIMEQAKKFKACIVQLIKPKSAGGWLDSGVEAFSQEDIEVLKKKVNTYNLDHKYADYPSISAQVIEEDREVFGCTAGGTDRFYINAKGDVQPCEFLNISYGNIAIDQFERVYSKMRDCFRIPGECALCEEYSKDILKLFRENELKSLPLPPDLSERVYKAWDRGEATELYKKMRKLE